MTDARGEARADNPEGDPVEAAGPREETVLRTTGAEADPGEEVAALVEADAAPEELARAVEAQESPDAADALESLEPDDRSRVLSAMQTRSAADALAHMELPLAATVLADLSPDETAEYLREMDPDDAADLLQSVDQAAAQAILEALPQTTAAALSKLALYDPETAGGMMTTDFIRLSAEGTVGDAREVIRRHPEELEHLGLYCADPEGRLVGEVSLKQLLLHKSGTHLSEIMERAVEVLPADLDREDVARTFERYDYLELPVVDAERRLLGLVTIDDVVDIIREEDTEDAFKQVGADKSEVVYSPLGQKVRSRLPWLIVNLLTASAAAAVVLRFEGLLNNIFILMALAPVIANQTGNAGHQSLAVTLRGIVMEQVKQQPIWRLLVKETALGAITGLTTGLVLFVAISLLGAAGVGTLEANWRIGVIACVAMTGALAVGCLMGAGMPLLMDRLGFDPATASSIFLTMLTDVAAFSAFLGLAQLFQPFLLGGSGGPAP